MLPSSPDRIMSESIETFWKEFESLATQKTEHDTTVAPWIVREQVFFILIWEGNDSLLHLMEILVITSVLHVYRLYPCNDAILLSGDRELTLQSI